MRGPKKQGAKSKEMRRDPERAFSARDSAAALLREVDRAGAGEPVFLAAAMRAAIAFAFLGVAATLWLAAAEERSFLGLMDDDAARASLFLAALGGGGLAASVLAANFAALTGRGGFRAARSAGALFGSEMARETQELSDSFGPAPRSYRGRASPAAMSALIETRSPPRALFSGAADAAGAPPQFRGYVARRANVNAEGRDERAPALAKAGDHYGAGALFVGVALFLALIAAAVALAPRIAVAASAGGLYALVAVGLAGFAAAGWIARGLSGGVSRARQRAEMAAFEAARRVFAASGAPDYDDLARLAAAGRPTPPGATPSEPERGAPPPFRPDRHDGDHGDNREEDRGDHRGADRDRAREAGDLDWRARADSGLRFVETGFSAAPKEWRADPNRSKSQ